MEQNLPIITKKAWNLIRVMFFMLKKGISKAKFTTNLNMMIKRGKIASKSLHKLLFHHHHNWVVATLPRHLPPPPSDDENEFSCTATPQNQNKLHYHLDANDSPMVKELRITDSPFALNNGDEDGDQVDEAAEKFIMRFYNSLRGQN
ncbi:ARID DNA-binding domain-containing protein [Tanacetum coccineum]|uniref:ARID DNA-binding domain-containing protein n=1 Tax=Tanacetum coccineum TaxID=301880 RepID=A0ABQ4WNJ5_9ASTR